MPSKIQFKDLRLGWLVLNNYIKDVLTMNINGTNTDASTYAMKKAIEMPKLMLNLVQEISNAQNQPLNAENSAVKEAPELSTITGKGKLIDITA